MNALFHIVEQSTLSVWAREGAYAHFASLILHAWGMALLVGGGIVISLRALGRDASSALVTPRALVPVMWCGVVLAVPSGFVLLVAYPAKALTNPVFGIKFACLAGAALLVRRLLRADSGSTRGTAFLCLLLWLGAVAAGKLLLHTYSVLMVS